MRIVRLEPGGCQGAGRNAERFLCSRKLVARPESVGVFGVRHTARQRIRRRACHSHLSATIGATFAARLAGIQHANSATHASESEIRMNVSGSDAVTPYRSGDMTRVSANAPAIPSARPASV